MPTKTTYDAKDKQQSRVSSHSLVRYKANDTSVQVLYGKRERRRRENGKQVGIWKIYKRNGEDVSNGPWEDSYYNDHDGITSDYDHLRERGTLKDGKPDGPWTFFYYNGQLKRKGNYKNGNEEGLWEEFDENGNLTKTEEYKDGELIE